MRFYVYDTKEKKTIGNGATLRCNAERFCQSMNVRQCGIDEIDKPAMERRFVIREV